MLSCFLFFISTAATPVFFDSMNMGDLISHPHPPPTAATRAQSQSGPSGDTVVSDHEKCANLIAVAVGLGAYNRTH
ncbi:hypothetical protein T492DRAFT_1052878 [Pavlovales sp. CCMP2436]|nr:hypothetical protein T492DRAFT_1052878 [Pavlovales sp. CCMP2436]